MQILGLLVSGGKVIMIGGSCRGGMGRFAENVSVDL